MRRRLSKSGGHRFFVHHDTHPQTIAVLATRAEPIGIELVVGDDDEIRPAGASVRCSACRRRAARSSTGPRDHGGARRRRLAVVADRPAGVHAHCAARRSSAPTSPSARRSDSASRWVSAARTPRSSPPRTACTSPARSPRRGQHRHRGPPGDAARVADPRAAHPPREGDVQHLHRAGAAGQHRRFLCRVARAGGPAPHRRDGCTGSTRSAAGAAPPGSSSSTTRGSTRSGPLRCAARSRGAC